MNAGNINAVFYATTYHPIQSGSIDGTDILPHDNAVYRALLCSAAGLYDPFGDPKLTGDPYCTVFVGRLSTVTDDESLKKAMSKYGKVKNLRLVRDIVTGASRGYAFVEYETEREMRCAYEDAHHSMIDNSEVIIDYNRQQLMPGWIPRRLGGGLGGRKESGQLRFGGRERPFRAPLRPIPYDDLKKLGIPAPPEGRYMSRFQIPSPPRRSSSTERKYSPSRQRRSKDRGDGSPRRRRSSTDRHDMSHRHSRNLEYSQREVPSGKRRSEDRGRQRSSTERADPSHKHHRNREHPEREDTLARKRKSEDREEPSGRQRKSSTERADPSHRHYRDTEYPEREDSAARKRSEDRDEPSGTQRKRSTERAEPSHKHRRDREYSELEDSSLKKRSRNVEERRNSKDKDGSSHRHHRHDRGHSYDRKRSTSEDYS